MRRTIHDRVCAARHRLRAAGVPPDEADLDARVLAQHVLGWDAARFFTDSDGPEPPRFIEQYDALVARRAGREPLAYITGRQEFWGLAFAVSPAVLIPRPETELIVERALVCLPDPEAPYEVADVCTGSGCLAVALACERPQARIMAGDISGPALDVAARNAETHGVSARLRFAASDLLAGVPGPFDLIVANPPYVPEPDRAALQPEVRDHEPGLALFAGPDGLDVIRRLVAEAAAKLRPGGFLIFEFGFGQADQVSQLISATSGLTMSELHRDLQDIPRTAVVKRHV